MIKAFIALSLAFSPSILFAADRVATYVLSFDKSCEFASERLICEPRNETLELRYQEGKWRGVSGRFFDPGRPITVIKNDRNIAVLNNTVSFSGTSIIHLSKITGRFIWTEIAYSEMLKSDETWIRTGWFVKK